MKKASLIILTLLFCSVIATPAFAQQSSGLNSSALQSLLPNAFGLDSNGGPGTNISIQAFPSNPIPDQEVSLSAENFLVDLDRSVVSWYVNGKLVQQRAGGTAIKVKVGPAGTLTRIEVYGKTTDGAVTYGSLTLIPAAVDLLWEAQTYTPPYYQGKALPSVKSIIKVVAMPQLVDTDGNVIQSKDIIFKWTLNGAVSSDKSGLGNDSFTIENSEVIPNPVVSVEATSVDGLIKATKTITIQSVLPSLILYQNDPLFGTLFTQAMPASFELKAKEISLGAYPYYFSVPTRTDPRMTYAWTFGNQTDNSFQTPDVTIGKPDGSGSTLISLQAANSKEVFQSANQEATLTFSSDNSQP